MDILAVVEVTPVVLVLVHVLARAPGARVHALVAGVKNSLLILFLFFKNYFDFVLLSFSC